MAKRAMVTRRNTTASLGSPGLIGAVVSLIKSLVMTVFILAVLGFCLNLVLKYFSEGAKPQSMKTAVKTQSAVKAEPAKAQTAKEQKKQETFVLSNPFRTPMYTVIGDKELTVFSDGSTAEKDYGADEPILPVLTGVVTGESAKKNGAFRQIIRLDKKYLAEISEVKINNPKDIVMITVNNKLIHFGDSVTNEKMSNYRLAMREYKKLRRQHSSVDLSVADRVIIK